MGGTLGFGLGSDLVDTPGWTAENVVVDGGASKHHIVGYTLAAAAADCNADCGYDAPQCAVVVAAVPWESLP